MRKPRRGRDERGFTLVELMVVVTILGILVAIAVASYYVATTRSKRIACVENQRTLSSSIVIYQSEHAGDYPPLLADLKKYVNWPSANYGRCTDGDAPLLYDAGTGTIACATPGHTP